MDPRTRVLHDGRTLLSPTGRLLRISAQGPQAIADLAVGRGDARAQSLARTLLDAGAAHPYPGRRPADDVTVVIPVKDRSAELERCLSALQAEVIVVDDGSTEDVAAVCAKHGARHVRRANGGPAAARNTALPMLDRAFVAFLDSDCVPPEHWLEDLRGHFDDPLVGAVAPRVQGGPRSPLDLGPRPAAVRAGGEVSYVPTAALLVRREALTPFDEALRYGEDVDAVWRLLDAGWVIRYDPSVVVQHTEPARLTDRLVRRFHYGTAAAPLSQRHPERLAHVVLPPWSTALVGLVLARKPLVAAAVAAWSIRGLDQKVQHLPTSTRVVAQSAGTTALGLGRALALLGPLAWRRSTAPLLIAPVLVEWVQRRPAEDPVRYVARTLLDQAAYGAGVVAGCVRSRTAVPLRPRRP